MSLLILNHSEVLELLPAEAAIPVMAQALTALAEGEATQSLRTLFQASTPGFLGLMPAHLPPSHGPAGYGVKAICVVPDNRVRGLDAHQGGVLLFSRETGQLLALMDGAAITAVRTAAVSALATFALARDDARELLIIGAGVQARHHLMALSHTRAFDRARIHSRNPKQAAALAAELDGKLGFVVQATADVESAARAADVIVTATTSIGPVLERAWISDGTHINAVGSCVPTSREIDGPTMAAATLIVDLRESAERESGDYLLALEEGAIGEGHIRAELGEVLLGTKAGRTSDDEITLFESLGLAVEDVAAGAYLYQQALDKKVGRSVDF